MDKMYLSLINYHYGMYLLERDPKLYVDYMDKEKKMKKGCYNCKYLGMSLTEEPCVRCNIIKNMWEPKEEKTMEKEFTKADLKNRMVVEYRDGSRRIVIDDILMGEHGIGHLTEYNNDLIHRWSSSLDIIRVFDEVDTFGILSLNRLRNMLLWERKEPKEVTLKEIAEKFGVDEVKIIDG